MEPIFGFIPAAARSAAAAPTVKEQPEVPQPGDEARERPLRPVMDEYIPEEKQEPAGRYWLGKDGDGQPRIFFDDPSVLRTRRAVPPTRTRSIAKLKS